MPENDRRSALILISIIIGVLTAYLVVILTSLYRNDWMLIWLSLGGTSLQIVPLVLIAHGRLRAGSFITLFGVIVTVTMMSTIGQGLHDIAIMAFPVIIIISSMMLQRSGFIIFTVLAITAVGWLVFGEVCGWFTPRALETTHLSDFLMMTAILLVAAFAMNQLATNLRKSLERAQKEILQRKQLEEQLRNQGNHDGLTDIYNRDFFEEELARLERSREFPVSVIVGDVDNLKEINDSKGHAAGDEILKHSATVLQATFRAADILARIGGDEFAVLLPNTDTAVAQKIMMRIIENLAKHNAEFPDIHVQLSLGMATAQTARLEDALALADQRMYANKLSRKNNS